MDDEVKPYVKVGERYISRKRFSETFAGEFLTEFGIDAWEISDEKLAILDEINEAHKRGVRESQKYEEMYHQASEHNAMLYAEIKKLKGEPNE